MSAAALIPSLIPTIVVLAMRRAEALIHGQLAGASAVTEATAVSLTLKRAMDRRRLQGLLRAGAVRMAANDRYFLDPTGWRDFLDRRRNRVLTALAVTLVLVGLGAAVFFAPR